MSKVTCRNETNEPVIVRMPGGDVTVRPGTEFHGTAEIQSHSLLHSISASLLMMGLKASKRSTVD